MKKDIHPKYQKSVIECACGNKIETRSAGGENIKVELCSACHPFFTGKQKFVDTAGRVDRFRARMEAAEAKKTVKATEAKEEEKATKADNKEVLEDIKAQITETPKAPEAIEVAQESTSDVEAAAAEELEIAEETESNEN